MLPERTTTTGDSVPVTHINAFHIINADVTIIPKPITSQRFLSYVMTTVTIVSITIDLCLGTKFDDHTIDSIFESPKTQLKFKSVILKRTERDGLSEKLTDLDRFDGINCFSDQAHDSSSFNFFRQMIQICRNFSSRVSVEKKKKNTNFLHETILEIGLNIERFNGASQTGLDTKD